MLVLRDYQQEMIDKVIESLKEGYRKIMIVLPTGGGKTAIASELVRRSYEKGKSSIFMCHRQELLDQTYATYGKNGIVPAFIKGGRHPDYNNPMQIASVNTLVRRLDKYKVPDIIFVDECFVGNTEVLTSDGYKKIKNIKAGDFVKTFNEKTKQLEYKRVLKLIKKERKEDLVCVSIGNRNIICTENHLFLTKKGWTKAKDLSSMDMVLSTTDRKGKNNDGKMCDMWFGGRTHKIKKRASEENRNASLSDLYQRKTKKNIIGNYGKDESEICLRQDEKKQSYEKRGSKRESFDYLTFYGMEAKNKRRKWTRSDFTSNAFSFCSRLGYGGRCSNRSCKRRLGLSNLLQNRYWEQNSKNSYRSRRFFSCFPAFSTERQEKTGISYWTRVESCKIYQRGNKESPDGLCSNRYVYDLTVEDNHNYFVEGILVHNCHHSKASQWSEILNWAGNAVVVGLTATPCRLDGKPLKDMYDKMIEVVTPKQLIEQGYLVPYLYYAPSIIDTSELVSANGDYTKKSLESASFNAKIIGDNIEQYKKIANGKRNVVFAISRRHGQDICDRYNAAGIKAEFLDGETPDKERKRTLERFKNGETKVLCNCDLFCEGYDLPAIEVVSLLRPTQSTALYLQQVGRALRTCPEIGKQTAIILDHVNNYKTHGLPDDEREWSLDGGYKGRKRGATSDIKIRRCPNCFYAHSPALVCPNCGYKYGADGEQIKEVAGELALIGSPEYKDLQRKEVLLANSLEELVRIERDRNYKFGYAERIWKEKTGINLWSSFNGLEEIAAARGYNKSWAWVQWQRIRRG